MHITFDRRLMLHGMALATAALPLLNTKTSAGLLRHKPGWVEGKLTGAQAVVAGPRRPGAGLHRRYGGAVVASMPA